MLLSKNLEQLCELVEYGTSARFTCPRCQGLKTLSISKHNGRVVYNCYKAKCDIRGSRLIRLSHEELSSTLHLLNASKSNREARTSVSKTFQLPTYWIQGIASKKCFQMLLNGNAIEAYEKGFYRVAYDPREDRLVFLVRNETGKIIGGIGKSLSNQKPKVYNYPDSANKPFLCGKGRTAVLVEDCLSACSIGRLEEYTGVALLGTELKKEYLFEILLGYREIIIALDKDAFAKAIKLKRIIQEFRENIRIWKLEKDLKELNKSELIYFILNTTKLIF